MSLVIAWRHAIVMIAIQPLIIMCFYTRRVLQNMSQKAIKAQDESSKLAAEAVTNLRTVTAFSSQERILQMLEKAQEGLRRESIRQSWFAGIGLALSQSLSTASWALDFWYGGKLIAKVTSQLKLSLSPIWFWPVQAVLLLLLEVWLPRKHGRVSGLGCGCGCGCGCWTRQFLKKVSAGAAGLGD